MKKYKVIESILKDRENFAPIGEAVDVFSPANIALCKYWGKRDQELNLPVTSSLSVSLGKKGTTTTLKTSVDRDVGRLNGAAIDFSSSFGKRLADFLNLFRTRDARYFNIDIKTNIPIAAGLASSASGFASLIHALNQLFCWKLSAKELSILARLGSGSASRSIAHGFFEWHRGERDDGFDSFAEKIPHVWPELCVGLLIVSEKEKTTSSREAMQRTVSTSSLYRAWPEKVLNDISRLRDAICEKDFEKLGQTAESNAMTMHATMLAAWPPVSYAVPETVLAMNTIWKLREEGLSLYFTQDAGPNLKLLFLEKELDAVRERFPTLDVVRPFGE